MKRLQASPSFIVTVSAVVLLAVGYLAWSVLRPNPYVRSERVVREARRELTYQVREFQRNLDDVVRQARGKERDPAVAIDEAAERAKQGIDEVVEAARDRLTDLDIELRTQRNRMNRIETRAQESRDMIVEVAEQAKTRARNSSSN